MRPSEVENDILVDLLVHGDDKAENIGRRVNRPPSSISRSISSLAEDQVVRDKGGGVYTLQEQGRNLGRSLIVSGYNPYVSD